MRLVKRHSVVGVIAVLALVAAACGSSSGDTTTTAITDTTTTTAETTTTAGQTTTTEPSGAALPPGTYQIGAIIEETGTLAFAGVASLLAIELAFEQANEAEVFGPGVTFELVVEDSASDQALGITAADLLINNPDILGLICCSSSAVTGAMKPAIDAAGLPTVIISAVLPTATEGDYFFRPKPPASTLYEALGPAVASAFDVTTAVVTRTSDNDGMVQTADIMVAELQGVGVEVTIIDVLSDDTDLSGPATQIVALDPDAVFHMELASTLGLSIREVFDRGYDKPQPGTNSMGNSEQFEIAGDAIVGQPWAASYFPGNPDPLTQEFVAAATPLFDGELPNIYAAEGYTAALFMIEALKRAIEASGGEVPTRQQVQEAMASIETLPSPQGTILMQDNHDGDIAVEDVLFLQWNVDGVQVLWDGTAAGRLRP